MKKCTYKDRIHEVEHSSFTLLIFSATGGMAHEASTFYKRLASLLSERWTNQYAAVLGWIRCCLSFSLLCSAIQCLRGSCYAHGSFGRPFTSTEVELVQAESKFHSAT